MGFLSLKYRAIMDPIIIRMLHPIMFRTPWLLRRFRLEFFVVEPPAREPKLLQHSDLTTPRDICQTCIIKLLQHSDLTTMRYMPNMYNSHFKKQILSLIQFYKTR